MNNNLIDYWSYSSMSSFLANPASFRRKYILNIRDAPSTPSAVVGSAAHKALEGYYGKGLSEPEAIELGLKYINSVADMSINYGKTGTRQNIVNTYGQAMRFYFAERPKFHELLAIEEGEVVEAKSVFDGQPLALPLKAISDVIARNKLGELEIIDHKFTSKHESDDEMSVVFKKFIQAMFNFHMVAAKYGEEPKRMIFNEVKTSKNKDNTQQIQPYTFEFDNANRAIYFGAFYKLYNACTENLHLDGLQFLPNPNDMFEGQFSFDLFLQGIDSIDAPVAVKHKTEAVQFVDKQYVPSAFDRIENKDFTPEERIRQKIMEFNIVVDMQETHVGPAVTQYTFKPPLGIKMSQFAKLHDDIAIALAARSVRIEAPIRGTHLVGIEVPSANRQRIDLAEQHLIPNTLNIPIGVDVYGATIHKKLDDMPHLLIAGATGAGKSVMLNVAITALTKQNGPDALQLVLVDPKRVELTSFANLPHMLLPIVFEDDEIATTLQLLTGEMDDRYKLLEKAGVRSINEYTGNMPHIVVVVDEFADLMMQSIDNSSEKAIIRIAQKARAVGIHLILATQRPSADVVTGLIKANVPTKIAFMTTSGVNSRIILDETGAEELTGKGDMLFLDPSYQGLRRLQGLYA